MRLWWKWRYPFSVAKNARRVQTFFAVKIENNPIAFFFAVFHCPLHKDTAVSKIHRERAIQLAVYIRFLDFSLAGVIELSHKFLVSNSRCPIGEAQEKNDKDKAFHGAEVNTTATARV